MNVYVLVRQTDGRCPSCENDEAPIVLGVYDTIAQVEARMARVARVNSQWPMRRISESAWRIGPADDEGFFGARPITFRALKATRHGADQWA